MKKKTKGTPKDKLKENMCQRSTNWTRSESTIEEQNVLK